VELTFNRVNIDFENQLFDPNWTFTDKKFRSICRELEWIYFFMEPNGHALSSDVEYHPEYLSKVKSITGYLPQITSLREEAHPWWGNPFEKREQEWNSKITSFQIAEELGLLPASSSVIQNDIELDSSFIDGMVIKSPFGFSGMGFKKKNEGVSQFPVIIEPWERRELDFGIRYVYKNQEYSIVENYIDSLGQFKGGSLRPELESKLDKVLLQKIFDKYQELGVSDSLQIDCYKTSSGFRYLVEANHRKTMGDFIKRVTEIYDRNDISIFFLNQKQSQAFEAQFSRFEKLSPEGRRFNCYLIEGIERSDVKNILN